MLTVFPLSLTSGCFRMSSQPMWEKKKPRLALWGSASVSENLWCTLWSRLHSMMSFWSTTIAHAIYITYLLECRVFYATHNIGLHKRTFTFNCEIVTDVIPCTPSSSTVHLMTCIVLRPYTWWYFTIEPYFKLNTVIQFNSGATGGRYGAINNQIWAEGLIATRGYITAWQRHRYTSK